MKIKVGNSNNREKVRLNLWVLEVFIKTVAGSRMDF
jgi:hypothetical protein